MDVLAVTEISVVFRASTVYGCYVPCMYCMFYPLYSKSSKSYFSVRLFTNREFVLVILSVVLIGPSMFSVGSYLSLQSITCFILRILRDRLIITDHKISAHNNSLRWPVLRLPQGCCYSIKTNSHLHQIPVALPQNKISTSLFFAASSSSASEIQIFSICKVS